MREYCPVCGVRFSREEGYFLGAYALNLVFAEFLGVGLALYLIFGTELRNAPLGVQALIAAFLATSFPIVLSPYARTFWMALDLKINPPGENPDRYFRSEDMRRHRPPQ